MVSKSSTSFIEEVPATPKVTSSFPSNSTTTPTIANESPSKNEDAIRQRMDKLRVAKSDSGLNREGPRNNLEELREKADNNLWQSKIDNLGKDVDA